MGVGWWMPFFFRPLRMATENNTGIILVSHRYFNKPPKPKSWHYVLHVTNDETKTQKKKKERKTNTQTCPRPLG